MRTVEKSYNLEDFRKVTKSASGRIGYILSCILLLVCGCGPSADDLCAEAEKKYLDGKIMEAFHDYSKVIDKYPNHAKGYNGQGNCYTAKYDQDKRVVNLQNAVDLFTKSIEFDRTYASPYMNRSQCYIKLGKSLEAYNDASKAIDLKPSESDFYYFRSLILSMMKLDDDALKDISKAIELKSSESGLYAVRGELLDKMKRIDDALKDLNKAISMDDGYMDYYGYRIELYLVMDKMDKADDDIDRALNCTKVSSYSELNLKQTMSNIYCAKGYILDRRDDIKGALEWLSKAMREDDKNAFPYKIRSDLYKRQGKLRESEADLVKAKELKEEYPER